MPAHSAARYQGRFLEIKNRFVNPRVISRRMNTALCEGRVV